MKFATSTAVMVGLTTMALLSWATFAFADDLTCPADFPPKPPCPEAANVVHACFVQEKFCIAGAAAQQSADAVLYAEASKKCSQQGQACYVDAAKICTCFNSGPASGGTSVPVVPSAGGSFGRGTLPTSGSAPAPIYIPKVSVPSWLVDSPAGQRGGAGTASGPKCADGTLIPQEASLLKLWIETGDGGSDPVNNDIDSDGVPDYKIKVKTASLPGESTGGAYIKDYSVQCDTCVKGANVCPGPEGGVAGKENCYNPSQKADFCK